MTFHQKREAMGLSASAFARLTGVHAQTVRGWERCPRRSRGYQDVPGWAWLLLRTWRQFPGSLEMARQGALETSHSPDQPCTDEPSPEPPGQG